MPIPCEMARGGDLIEVLEEAFACGCWRSARPRGARVEGRARFVERCARGYPRITRTRPQAGCGARSRVRRHPVRCIPSRLHGRGSRSPRFQDVLCGCSAVTLRVVGGQPHVFVKRVMRRRLRSRPRRRSQLRVERLGVDPSRCPARHRWRAPRLDRVCGRSMRRVGSAPIVISCVSSCSGTRGPCLLWAPTDRSRARPGAPPSEDATHVGSASCTRWAPQAAW